MSERDDYLHDPSLPPDPEIVAIERALAPLRWREQPWRERGPTPAPASPRRWPWFAAVAAGLLVGLLVWMLVLPADELQPGAPSRPFVTEDAARTIRLGDLAEITLRPGSELAFVHWRADEARFDLVRGGLSARVEPPPKVPKAFFVVGTAHGRVVDQGCRYTLDVLPDGRALVRVTEGAVTFEFPSRTVFVPAGAAIEVDANGPATPVFDDAAPELVKVTREFEALRLAGADFDARAASLKRVIAAARAPRDSLVLWHLLRDPEPMLREPSLAALADLVGVPPGHQDAPQEPEDWLPWLRLRVWRLP